VCVGAGCHWCRRAAVVLVLAGLRGQCVGRDGGSAGLCSGSWPVPLGSGRPTSTPLIHEGVNTRVNTHSLTRRNTLVCVGVDETGYFCGPLVSCGLLLSLSSPNVPKSMANTKEEERKCH